MQQVREVFKRSSVLFWPHSACANFVSSDNIFRAIVKRLRIAERACISISPVSSSASANAEKAEACSRAISTNSSATDMACSDRSGGMTSAFRMNLTLTWMDGALANSLKPPLA